MDRFVGGSDGGGGLAVCGVDERHRGAGRADRRRLLAGAAAHPSLPRGALLQIAVGERPPLARVLGGPSDDPFGGLNLVGGLRRSMAKAGYCDLKEFQKVGLTVGG